MTGVQLILVVLAILFLTVACGRQEPIKLSPRHVTVLSENQITSPLTVTAVKDELHILYGNLDTLTLNLSRLDPYHNRHTLEIIDLIGIYPADLTWFGVHAYAVHNGRQHVVYLDQQQANVLIPKWIYRDAGEEQWWVTSPLFEGTPRALLPQDDGPLLLVAATPNGATIGELLKTPGSGRHQQSMMGDYPSTVWPLACAGQTSFMTLAPDSTLQWRLGNGSTQSLLEDVDAYHAACVDGLVHILWHVESTNEVLFTHMTRDGQGPTTAVTLAIGTTSVYLLPHRNGFSFVIDEFLTAAPGDGRHRISLIHPDEEQPQDGYRKSVLVDDASPLGFSAAHLDDLLIIVEPRVGESKDLSIGLRASIYSLP